MNPSHNRDTGISRPRLLFLCQTLPFPPVSGVLIRTYNVLRLLSREFDVTALCFYRKDTHATEELLNSSAAELQSLAKLQFFPIPQEHSHVRLLLDHMRITLTGKAYTIFAYDSGAFRQALRSKVREENFDLVHMDSLDLAAYLPDLEHLPVACVHHNVESILLRRRAASRGGVAGQYMAHQARLTAAEEKRWCPKVALNVAVSPDDRDAFLEMAPKSKFTVVPNGVDTEIFRPEVEAIAQQGIIFVGRYSWQPNRDAMHFFCQKVLHLIRESGEDPSITWVGRASLEVVQEYRDRYGVRLTGHVEDIRPLVTNAACYIAQLMSGGGTRLKILDAWAMGKAVVSTSVGCEGLNTHDGENILIRDDPADFARAVTDVLNDVGLRSRLGKQARQSAEDTYDWEVIGRPMLKTYLELCSV